MEFVVFLLVFALLWAWIEITRSKESFRQQLAVLSRRVWTLEQELHKASKVPAPQPVPAPTQQPVAAPVHEPVHHAEPPVVPVAKPIPEFAPAFMETSMPPVIPPPPVVPPAPVVPPVSIHEHTPPPVPPAVPHEMPEPAPVFNTAAPPPRPVPPRIPTPPPAAPAKPRGALDWEMLIGGNLLNKLGALVFVIGVISFLAYYGTQMGPLGRASCAVVVSLAMLGVGVWLERSEIYRLFARGLIGAGWAALYATAYAVHALPAARIIENPYLASFLLLVVAAGMIGHSLRYRAEAVTAVAFFSAFAALSLTPSTSFAVLALIPLAASVLYLAQRFNWYHMALMGIVATYGTCASRGSSGAPLIETETLFIAYWALFEVFDLMRFSRKTGGWAIELIFPLNAAGFLTLSYASWNAKSPENIWMLSACAAAMYIVSALWRVKLELDRGFDTTQDIAARVRSGGFEAPLALGAFLTAAAIVQKLTGMWSSTALALEAEFLFIAGIRFRSGFIRALGTAGFIWSLVLLADTASANPASADVFGHSMHVWVAIALFHALLFYVNRALSERTSILGILYAWAGSLLVMAALGDQLPFYLVGAGWMILATVLFELAIRKVLPEFRYQAYLIAFAGVVQSLFFFNHDTARPWIALAIGTAFTYTAAWRASSIETSQPESREWSLVGWFACAFTAIFSTVLVVKEVPDRYAGIALWGLAVLLLELGLERLPSRLRVFSYPIAALATLASLSEANTRVVKSAPPEVWLTYLGALAAAWIMSGRLTLTSPDNATRLERAEARSLLSAVGLMFGLVTLWMLVPDEFVPAAWAALGLATLEAGRALDVAEYRWEGHAVAALAALSSFGLTLSDPHTHRVPAILLLMVVHVAFRLVSPVRPDIEGKVPALHLAACTILAFALIYQEVSGSLLTLSWGGEALGALGIGFAMRDRSLRLQGLGLFLICVLKLFLYDLRNLETPYRILSFIALGLILLGVSWIYTRFREQLQKIL